MRRLLALGPKLYHIYKVVLTEGLRQLLEQPHGLGQTRINEVPL
jgi:hypothetical protein